jgi:hypothetical protein
LHIKNTPVQAVSINGCEGLTVINMTIDNSAGDSAGGHNTDAFDIGSSSGITIVGAQVYNQDDCVAVNSGTVCVILFLESAVQNVLLMRRHYRILHFPKVSAPVATDYQLAPLVGVQTTLLRMSLLGILR